MYPRHCKDLWLPDNEKILVAMNRHFEAAIKHKHIQIGYHN